MLILSPAVDGMAKRWRRSNAMKKKQRAMKQGTRITSQVTVDIIDDFQNRYLSVAKYINYKVISQSRSSHSSSFMLSSFFLVSLEECALHEKEIL